MTLAQRRLMAACICGCVIAFLGTWLIVHAVAVT